MSRYARDPISGSILPIAAGGHIILDEEGTPYPQRDHLKFERCEVTDDGINDATIVKCEGKKITIVQLPEVTIGTYTYNKEQQAPVISGLDEENTIITGIREATSAGQYTFTIALKNANTMVWSDLTNTDLIYTWSIGIRSVTVPTVTDTEKGYTGSTLSPTITRDTTYTTLTGDYSESDVGTYTFTVALYDADSCKWGDDTTAEKHYTWSITIDGKTATPVNDIQMWLKCAMITDKSYTTLSEVLNDATTLSTLMLSNNAADYLVRSTEWAKNDGLVPTMTSYTTPSGEVLRSSNHSSVPAWKAFDGDDSTFGAVSKDGSALYIGYHFIAPTVCAKVYIKLKSDGAYVSERVSFVYKIQGSNDGTTWSDVTSNYTISTSESEKTIIFSPNTAYSYYRIYSTTGSGNGTGGAYLAIVTTQFYAYDGNGITEDQTAMTDIGLDDYCADTLLADSTWRQAICNSTYFESVLNVKVPVMASNTTPSGVCSASNSNSSYEPWKAFDSSDTTAWMAEKNTSSGDSWLQYTFSNNIKAYKLYIKCSLGGTFYGVVAPRFQYYDNTTSAWVNLFTDIIRDNDTRIFQPCISDKYRFIEARHMWAGDSSTYYSSLVYVMQIYGRVSS